jgi:hypothetical protein
MGPLLSYEFEQRNRTLLAYTDITYRCSRMVKLLTDGEPLVGTLPFICISMQLPKGFPKGRLFTVLNMQGVHTYVSILTYWNNALMEVSSGSAFKGALDLASCRKV